MVGRSIPSWYSRGVWLCFGAVVLGLLGVSLLLLRVLGGGAIVLGLGLGLWGLGRSYETDRMSHTMIMIVGIALVIVGFLVWIW